MPSAPAGSERFGRPGAFSGDAQIESLRLPPHSVEAEQAVLGGLLLSNQAWDRIGDILAESDFYRADHRILWRCITRLVEDNKPADIQLANAIEKTELCPSFVVRPHLLQGKSEREIRVMKAKMLAQKTIAAARAVPGWLEKLRKRAVERSQKWAEPEPARVHRLRQGAQLLQRLRKPCADCCDCAIRVSVASLL